MIWKWPLRSLPILPDEPGQFRSIRAEDVHTGVDLYCELGTDVVAVEAGVVVAIEWFTGQHVRTTTGEPASWWNDTRVILVKGASGIVAYGEVTPVEDITIGSCVRAEQTIAVVDTAVLRSFKGRPMVMLHIELYSDLVPDKRSWSPSHTAWWEKGTPCPAHLLDPTPHLVESVLEFQQKFSHPCSSKDFRFDITTYNGTAFRDPAAPSKPSKWWAMWGGSYPS